MAFQKFFAHKVNRAQKQPQTEPPSPIPYALPNNIQEVNRLDFQHYMLRYALENNFLAPITSQQAPGTILDIGCGTGRLGQMSLTNTQSALNGLKLLICPFANMFDQEYETLLAQVYQEFEEFNTSLQFTIAYGQKAFETA